MPLVPPGSAAYESSGKNSFLSNYVEGVLSSESNLAEDPVAVDPTKRSLAKEHGQSYGKTSLLSAPGSVVIKTRLMKPLVEALWCTKTVFFSKQVRTTVAGRQRDAQTIEAP